MAAADADPEVSGSTIALIIGIYEFNFETDLIDEVLKSKAVHIRSINK